jgi:hypothetical protein
MPDLALVQALFVGVIASLAIPGLPGIDRSSRIPARMKTTALRYPSVEAAQPARQRS